MSSNGEGQQGRKVMIDDRNIAQSYANFVNASATREEVSLLFGANQNWNTGGGDVRINLSNQVILNPYAAKRLAGLLVSVINQYEDRFGAIELGQPSAQIDPADPDD